MLRPELRRSSLGLLVAGVLLLAHVSGLAHLMLVEHQRCPEHGELVHARERPRSDLIAAAGAVLTVPSLEGGHAHDHCLACITERQTAGAALPAAQPAIFVGAGSLLVAPAAARDPRLPLLRLAPKTSPPSIG